MPTTLPPPGDPKALYLLDLSGYVFRAYHALPPLSSSKGEPTNATLGMANMLNRLVREQKPQYLAVAMDSKSEGSYRKKIFPEYKATRPPAPPDLAQQMRRCRELSEAYALPVLAQDGFEADDMIAACVREARGHGLRTVICSADKDLMQLVADDVLMWDGMRNRVYGSEDVREKWGVTPEQLCDLLALMGDTSDNIPGVAGVGEKTAAKLIAEYGSLDGVYEHIASVKGKLRDNLTRDEANARLSYKLVSLTLDLPVQLDLEKLRYGGWDAVRLRALLRDLEFQRLADAVEVPTAVPATSVPAASSAAVQSAPRLQGPAQLSLLPDGQGSPDLRSCRFRPTTVVGRRIYRADSQRARRPRRRAVLKQAPPHAPVAIDVAATSLDPMRATPVGISLSWANDSAVYVPFGHRVIGDPPQLEWSRYGAQRSASAARRRGGEKDRSQRQV